MKVSEAIAAKQKHAGGRKRVLSPERERELVHDYITDPKLTREAVGARYGVSTATVTRILREAQGRGRGR